MKAGNARRVAALAVLFAAGLASLATSPAPRDENAMLEFTVHVPANSAAARRADVEIMRGDAPIGHAGLEAAPGYDDYGEPSYVASISIVPDDPFEPMLPVTRQPFDFLGDTTHDLSPFCEDGCTRSYIIIVRNDSLFDRDALVSLYAFAYAATNASPGTRLPTAKVRLSDEQPSSGLQSLATEMTGSLDSDLFGSSSWHGIIQIPAAAYDADSGRVFGSLLLNGRQTFDGDNAIADAWISVSGASKFGARIMENAADDLPAEREWLSSCTRGTECSVPIDIELRWAAPLFIGGHVHLDFTLEARLEYLELNEVPAGATIEILPG